MPSMKSHLLFPVLYACTVIARSHGDGGGKWPWQSYQSFPWNATVLSWEKKAPTVPGYLFFAPIGSDANVGGYNAPTIMTDEGDLVWRAPGDSVTQTRNLNLQNLNGSNVLTYWSGSHNNYYGAGYGAVTVLDDTYTQLYNVCMAALPVVPIQGTNIDQPCTLDDHESRITSRGTLLATVRNVTRADITSRGGEQDGYLLDSLFYEIDPATQEVLFRWSAYEHRNDGIDMFALSATNPGRSTSPSKPWDFFHMNSIYEVPAPLGGYLISARYLSSVIKLDQYGNIEWYLDGSTGGGNFTLPTSGSFSFQHDAIANNVTKSSLQITLFDNANRDAKGPPNQESSGLEVSLDLKHFTATTYRRLLPNNFTASPHTGSYQSLPQNHVLIDYGHPPVFNEFDADDNLIYIASPGPVSGEVYRAYRYNFTSSPATLPDISVQQNPKHSTTAYVSWNGATQVATWQFVTGKDCASAQALGGKYAREGFETAVQLQGKLAAFVGVLAWSADGVLLGKSRLVAAAGGATSGGVDGVNVLSCS